MANDRQAERTTIASLEDSVVAIKQWMDANRLKMNSSKTEFTIFAAPVQLAKCVTKSVLVTGDNIQLSKSIKYLGVTLDASLNLKQHISNKCRTAMFNLQKIKHIRPFLTEEACHTIVHGLVISHLDYANSLYQGLPDCSVKRFQRVQNMAAKIILRKGKYDSATQCLKTLHWLPVRRRVEHKLLTLGYKCIHGDAPVYMVYLQELLVKSCPTPSKTVPMFMYLNVN